jgi:hypothetical protein
MPNLRRYSVASLFLRELSIIGSAATRGQRFFPGIVIENDIFFDIRCILGRPSSWRKHFFRQIVTKGKRSPQTRFKPYRADSPSNGYRPDPFPSRFKTALGDCRNNSRKTLGDLARVIRDSPPKTFLNSPNIDISPLAFARPSRKIEGAGNRHPVFSSFLRGSP